MSDDDGNYDESWRPYAERRLARVAKKSTYSDSSRSSSSSSATAYTTRRQAALKAKALNSEPRFLDNFDPDNSARERRKITKKVSAKRIPGALYDEAGVHISSELDLCDCLQKTCRGCFFPCKKCGSQKCGPDCRSNRKFVYEEIDYHGYDFVVHNPVLD